MLVFTGDINLTDNAFDVGYGVGTKIAEGLNPFSKIIKLRNECWIGNFEGVCSDTSEITSYLKDCFRVGESYISRLGLIDYYSVANNHVMEHGPKAYNNTINAIKESGADVFGSLAQKSISFEHDGKSIAIMAFSLRNDNHGFKPLYWNFPEYCDITDEFKRLATCDYKIAYIHWGVEFIEYPSIVQRQFAHWLIDLGFDLIVGMHPHVLQGYEIYKEKYIFYSLGNFVFNMAWPDTNYGAIVKLDVETGDVALDYIHIGENYSPETIDEIDVPEHLRFDALNSKIYKYDNIESYCQNAMKGLKNYRRSNNLSILRNLYRTNLGFAVSIVKDFIFRRLHII